MALAVGLMSGTSIDGIDAALVSIQEPSKGSLKIRLLNWSIDPFPKGMRERILAEDDFCRLNFELGELFAKSVIRLCRKARVPLSKISVIGSHGQTIGHLGREGTLQIGEPSVIAERTGITTVADFRPRDIAAGGFGAPLAPYFHYLFFGSSRETRIVQNIGGIGNLTFLPKKGGLAKVIGFDTGPGNMVIDGILRETTNNKVHYDHGGKIAARGIVSLKLLKELLSHPFISKKPPKTAGREEFGRPYVKSLLRRAWKLGLRQEDVIATATALTATSIAENYRRFLFPRELPEEIIFGGGGIHNKALMAMIRAEIPGVRLKTFDDHGLPADAAEAVCFAVLAYQTLRGRPTNIPSVTGARHPAVLGKIIPGNINRSFLR
jgi:anhydro-N-acetylmuramic acid kinase